MFPAVNAGNDHLGGEPAIVKASGDSRGQDSAGRFIPALFSRNNSGVFPRTSFFKSNGIPGGSSLSPASKKQNRKYQNYGQQARQEGIMEECPANSA
jgi:hypothetical protein